MRFAVVFVGLGFALVACSKTEPDDYHVHDQGNGHGGMGSGSGSDDIDAMPGAMITGRVCVLTDPRQQGQCVANPGQIMVQLGTAQALTGIDGSFSIASPAGSNPLWRLAGAGIVATIIPFSTATTLPAISQTRYEDLAADNGGTFDQNEGGVFAAIVQGGLPVAGLTATIDPPSASTVYYDGSSDQVWDMDMTGIRGLAWFPDAQVVSSTISVAIPQAAPVLIQGIPVEAQTITFITIAL